MGNREVRLFVGTSSGNQVELGVLLQTVQANTQGFIKIFLLNGDSCTIEGGGMVQSVEVPSELKAQYVTRFTAMRFAIPEVCGYQGKAIYVDSDQLVLGDLGELAKFPAERDALAAVCVADARSSWRFKKLVLERLGSPEARRRFFLASVLVFDCSRCRFTLRALGSLLREGMLRYEDVIWLGPGFRRQFGLEITPLPPEWNALDVCPAGTKIVHLTDLSMQPWRYSHHPLLALWREHLVDAIRSGRVNAEMLRNQHGLGKLSWSTLQLGLSMQGGRPGPAGLRAILVRLYDWWRGMTVELYWRMKLQLVMLRRAVR